MKQQITRFEKSTPRMLAFVLMGVGLIGLALVQGGPALGLELEVPGAALMLLGFIGATIFFAVMGSEPVPAGTEEVEAEEGVQVKLSDELENDMKQKVDQALQEVVDETKASLKEVSEKADGVSSEVDRIKSELEKVELESMAQSLKSVVDAFDADATAEMAESFKNSVSSVTSKLDELNSLSTQEVEKLENQLTEIKENFESVRGNMSSEVDTLINSLKQTDDEVNRTLKQFEGFNRNES